MRLGGCLLFAASLLLVAQAEVDAEIDRVSIKEVLKELSTAKHALSPDRREFSVPAAAFVSRVPDMIRIALPDNGERKPASLRAIFAVKQPGGEIGDTKTVRIVLVDGAYVVSWRSKRSFRTWLLKRVGDLFEGNVVLERIVGLESEGISLRLSIEDVSEELFALADAEWESGRTERGLQQTVGTSIVEGTFGDLDGGSRRIAEFEGRTLLLHIWATWCPPCIAEMPALEALQDRYGDSGLTVVNLSDEPVDVIRDWLAENPTTMVHGRVDAFEFLLGDPLPEGVDRTLGTRPVYMVVDREAIVREAHIGFVERNDPDTANPDTANEPEHHVAVLVKPYL